MLAISEVQVAPVKPRNGLVGFASFVLYESIYCSSVGIMTRPGGGYRLAYPTRKIGGSDVSVFYPINRQVGRAIENAVIFVLEDVMSKSDDRYSCDSVTRNTV